MANRQFSMESETDECAHCKAKIVAGDRVLAYIDNDKAKTKNIGKLMVHEQCAEAFFGQSKRVQ